MGENEIPLTVPFTIRGSATREDNNLLFNLSTRLITCRESGTNGLNDEIARCSGKMMMIGSVNYVVLKMSM